MARDHIRTLRKLSNLSQGALAKATGLTASEISRIECGYRDLSATEARAIAKALGVSVGDVSGEFTSPAETSTSGELPASAVAVSSAPPPIASNDLNDPANFREMPDFGLLNSAGVGTEEFLTRLRHAIQRATDVLHTSRVPAAIWRAWREFERQAQNVLRASASENPVPSIVPEPRANNHDLLLLAERSFQARRTSKIKHREKSFNALLFEVAHQALPMDVSKKLIEEAERRSQDNRLIGFMRHFRSVVQERLSRAELEKVLAAVEAREANHKSGFQPAAHQQVRH